MTAISSNDDKTAIIFSHRQNFIIIDLRRFETEKKLNDPAKYLRKIENVNIKLIPANAKLKGIGKTE